LLQGRLALFELVEAIHKALHTQSALVFVIVCFLVFGSLAGGVAWLIDLGYKNELREKPSPNDEIDLRTRISELLSQGNRLQATCQTVPNPYHTPPEARADLANSIVNWQQRAETILSLDPDPYVAMLWQRAILYSNPHPPAVSDYCTTLGVKMDILEKILSRKNTTPAQIRSKMQGLIEEGESLEEFALESGDEKAIKEREISWVGKTYDWLRIYLNDSSQSDFNNAGSSAANPKQPPRNQSSLAVWQRTKARVDALRRISNELNNNQDPEGRTR
jgi:uncharacterized protein YjiS (DUF1127 family)